MWRRMTDRKTRGTVCSQAGHGHGLAGCQALVHPNRLDTAREAEKFYFINNTRP